MKKLTKVLLAALAIPAFLAGCILVPVDDGYYHHGRHHGGGYYDYDGRYDRGGYYGRRY